ncbi:FAD-dependent oxidoreductase [Sphingomonas sp. ASY06-1R]|uniref:FAD-dependent oxidoreductase n=1 Tax=Sphingomonas sp. ASY06-1R TaxID=3445771 RepID=UPI003FA30AD4
MRTIITLIAATAFGAVGAQAATPRINRGAANPADLVVYGCTSAGVTAAVAASDLGKTVTLLCTSDYVGGMTTNGLGWSDTGNHRAIGGMALQFYREIKRWYDQPGAWTASVRPSDATENFVNDGAQWIFEPHVAERIYDDWLRRKGITVVRNERLDRDAGGVTKRGTRIVEIRAENGKRYPGKMFIDATYEGDLMAAAGVSFAVGREANATYGETLNGVQTRNSVKHQFTQDIDPYVVPGQPASGLLPHISAERPGPDGSADRKVQAYMYRLCLTDVAANRAPLPRPDGYDPREFALLGRYLATGVDDVFRKFDRIPNGKTDVNNWGAFSFDAIGMNYAYPTASYTQRDAILTAHRRYQQGVLWYLAHDAAVPPKIRTEMQRWGLCRDEFTRNANWPREIYVREGRRMVSDFVMAEPYLTRAKPTPEPIGMGSYNMDSHNVQRIVDARGFVRNEGNIEVSPGDAYPISYRAIVPKRTQATNLLVPVALSASHIAYGSIRMEPVFMILGESAATAASLAIDGNTSVQDVAYPKLQAALLRRKQILSLEPAPAR